MSNRKEVFCLGSFSEDCMMKKPQPLAQRPFQGTALEKATLQRERRKVKRG